MGGASQVAPTMVGVSSLLRLGLVRGCTCCVASWLTGSFAGVLVLPGIASNSSSSLLTSLLALSSSHLSLHSALQ